MVFEGQLPDKIVHLLFSLVLVNNERGHASGEVLHGAVLRASYLQFHALISQTVFIKSFCKSQFPHKFGNLSLIITDMKN